MADSSVAIAAVQVNVELGNKQANIEKCLEYLRRAAEAGANLVVFPECCVTGYVFESYDEAIGCAEPVPGPSSQAYGRVCAEYKVWAIFGLLERDGDDLFNTAVVVGPEGVVGKYRKTHLLCLGVDRFASRGDQLKCFRTPFGIVGITICYDMRFPEASRVLALAGAQVIAHPANLPAGAEVYADFLNRARACENRVYVVSANRVGQERGVRFIGRTQIIGCGGEVVSEAGPDEETIVYASITPALAAAKRVVRVRGEYEYDLLLDRRPDLYGSICDRSVSPTL